MCGFAGIYPANPICPSDLDAVKKMSQAIRHRGPDDSKQYAGGQFAAAFRRLSIIDLESGEQPFTTEDGRFIGIFNGEIYNYLELRDELLAKSVTRDVTRGVTCDVTCDVNTTFATRSEIEVLCALYRDEGPAFLARLRGMFAIAIYDTVENTVFLARDPFGIKPLYYRQSQDAVTFSSEGKAFLFDPHWNGFEVDEANLQSYFTFQYVTEPDTVVKDIKILPAGCYAVLDQRLAVNPVPYFRLSFAPNASMRFDDKEKALRRAVEKSVEYHLLSDVPVGSFLSSGIDSAVITAVASKLCPGIKAFTVAFGVKEFSEIDDASAIAEHLDIEHIKLTAGLEDFISNFEKVVYHLDFPVADPSVVAIYLICKQASRHVKTVLSGEGSDELFAGYRLYRESLSSERLFRLPAPVRHALHALADRLPDGVKGKNLLYRGTTPLQERYVGNAFLLREEQKKPLYKKYSADVSFTDRTAQLFEEAKGYSRLEQMQYVDLNTWLKSDILVKGDRLSMANSLEVRVPYLDKEVFEAARVLCDDDKLSKSTTKYILRHAFRDLVNQETVMRPKLGYPVPVRVWLKDELYDWAKDIIMAPCGDEFIDKKEAIRLLDAHRKGESDCHKVLWAVLCFLTWYRLYVADADGTRARILEGEL